MSALVGIDLEVVATKVYWKVTHDVSFGLTTILPCEGALRNTCLDLQGSRCRMVLVPAGAEGLLAPTRKGKKDEEGEPRRLPPPKQKRPSQRLRDVIYVRWREGGEHGEFDEFYRAAMNEIIDEQLKRIPNNTDA